METFLRVREWLLLQGVTELHVSPFRWVAFGLLIVFWAKGLVAWPIAVLFLLSLFEFEISWKIR